MSRHRPLCSNATPPDSLSVHRTIAVRFTLGMNRRARRSSSSFPSGSPTGGTRSVSPPCAYNHATSTAHTSHDHHQQHKANAVSKLFASRMLEFVAGFVGHESNGFRVSFFQLLYGWWRNTRCKVSHYKCAFPLATLYSDLFTERCRNHSSTTESALIWRQLNIASHRRRHRRRHHRHRHHRHLHRRHRCHRHRSHRQPHRRRR
jgi:hypothetical protein